MGNILRVELGGKRALPGFPLLALAGQLCTKNYNSRWLILPNILQITHTHMHTYLSGH